MLARFKVPRAIAEIALNHVTGAGRNDLDEIYDRYEYLDEKKEALAMLERHLIQLSRLVDIDQYDETALGNRDYVLNRPYSIGGKERRGSGDVLDEARAKHLLP